MKKELKELLNLEDGYLKVNGISNLHRWTKDALGQSVDCLEIIFDSPLHGLYTMSKKIESRETIGIINEIAAATEEFFRRESEKTVSEIKAGYVFK